MVSSVLKKFSICAHNCENDGLCSRKFQHGSTTFSQSVLGQFGGLSNRSSLRNTFSDTWKNPRFCNKILATPNWASFQVKLSTFHQFNDHILSVFITKSSQLILLKILKESLQDKTFTFTSFMLTSEHKRYNYCMLDQNMNQLRR